MSIFTVSDEGCKSEVWRLILRLMFIHKTGKKRGKKKTTFPEAHLGSQNSVSFTLFLAANIYTLNSLGEHFFSPHEFVDHC